MSYSNPAAWWGLWFIIIPLLIFLLSKKKQQIIPFGSLVFLEETESHAAKSIFPSEWLPFFLRSLLIGLICFLLAQPQFPVSLAPLIYIEEDIYQSEDFAMMVNDLEVKYDLQRFSFSPREAEESVKYFPSAWTLIDYLNHNQPQTQIYTFNFNKNFKGSPIVPRQGIEIHSVPLNKPNQYRDTVAINDQELLIVGESDDKGWRWEYDQVSAMGLLPSSLSVSVLFSHNVKSQGEKLMVTMEKLAEELPLALKKEPIDKVDILFIIGDTIVDKSYESKVVWNQHTGALKLFQNGNGDYEISGALDKENLINSNFTLALSNMLLNQLYDMNRLDQSKKRFEVGEVANAEQESIDAFNSNQSLGKLWWLIVFLVLGVERWVVYKLQGNEE